MSATMRRRDLLAAGAAVTLGGSAAFAAPRRRPPNFIVVQCDDMGAGDWGREARGLIATPHLDRLAREGTTFPHFYAGANLCTPSRAAMLTGRYAIRSGLGRGVLLADDTRVLPPSEVTIAEALRATHRSALIGKWHLGHKGPTWMPTAHGFDLFYGLPYSHDIRPLSLFDTGEGAVREERDPPLDTLQQRFWSRAERFIVDNRARPFFLDLALSSPHLENFPVAPFKGRSRAGPYGDTVEEIDDIVGRLTRLLRRLGLARDTLVIFTSDNGPWFEGSPGAGRGRKGDSAFDGGYRVPMIAWQPGTVPAGRTCDAIGMSIDFLPTFCAMAGTPPPAGVTLDGRDISAMMTRGAPSPHARDGLLLFDNEDVVGVRTQRWKYVLADYYRGPLMALDARGYPQLYDLERDPGESYSLAAREPQVLAAMRARVAAARATFGPMVTGPSTIRNPPRPSPVAY